MIPSVTIMHVATVEDRYRWTLTRQLNYCKPPSYVKEVFGRSGKSERARLIHAYPTGQPLPDLTFCLTFATKGNDGSHGRGTPIIVIAASGDFTRFGLKRQMQYSDDIVSASTLIDNTLLAVVSRQVTGGCAGAVETRDGPDLLSSLWPHQGRAE